VADAQIPGSLGKAAREHDPELVHAFRDLLAAAPLDGIVGALEAMMARPDSTPTLATIDVPTLVVVGRDDVLTRPSDARAMHQRMPGSRFEIIDQAGHASSFERPAEFNRLLREFLARIAELEPTGAARSQAAP
jgi:pimeloyl-ACP methyl ester carboxylesterase